MIVALISTCGWQPSNPLPWAGAARYGAFFDPVNEFGPYITPKQTDGQAPLLLSLPGLDGHPLTAFVQFPSLARDYDVVAWAPDRSNAAAGSDHEGFVTALASYIAGCRAAGRERGTNGGAGHGLDD